MWTLNHPATFSLDYTEICRNQKICEFYIYESKTKMYLFGHFYPVCVYIWPNNIGSLTFKAKQIFCSDKKLCI